MLNRMDDVHLDNEDFRTFFPEVFQANIHCSGMKRVLHLILPFTHHHQQVPGS